MREPIAVPVRRLSWSVIHFVAIHASAGENRQKITKNPVVGIQDYLRSSMLIRLKTTSPLLVMISSMSVPICKRFHARQANIRKITTSWGIPLFDNLMRRPH